MRSSCNEVVYDVTIKDSNDIPIRAETNLTTTSIVLEGQHVCSEYTVHLTAVNNENFSSDESVTWTTPTIGKRCR